MSKLKGLIYIVPPLFITMLFLIICTNFFSQDVYKLHSFLITTLLIFIPACFFIQGLICALFKANLYIALGASEGVFLIFLFICLNTSAMIYLLFYFVIAMLGFGIGQFIVAIRRL